jgi:hypothetical protein
MNLSPTPSPTGTPVIPPAAVPYVIAAIAILQVFGAAFALPGPWTPERTFMVAQGILSVLVGGALPGLRR